MSKQKNKRRSNTPFVLASGSPRRIELLKNAGIQLEVCPPDVDETVKPGEKPATLVKRLSRSKARAILKGRKPKPGTLILAADTIVVAPDGSTILGKPRNEKESAAMLAMIAGKTHQVFTGYCLIQEERNGHVIEWTRVVKTKVEMRALTTSQIQAYIKSGEPSDKAGSYAAQGIGMGLIRRISGSYTNVVGLPLAEVLDDLASEFDFHI
jgi:septum formation protein